MPIMDVRYAAGSLDKKSKAALAQRLTDVLIRMEGGANTHGGRGFATVFFTEVAEDNWWVGGSTGGEYVSPPGKFLVLVYIPEGYMNIAHKNEVHAWVASAIAGVLGTTEPGNSIQTVINEVTEGNWGNAGHPISLENISVTVGQPKDGPRMKWSHSYFEAKARVMSGAGYPIDAGGMVPSLTPDPAKERKSAVAR